MQLQARQNLHDLQVEKIVYHSLKHGEYQAHFSLQLYDRRAWLWIPEFSEIRALESLRTSVRRNSLNPPQFPISRASISRWKYIPPSGDTQSPLFIPAIFPPKPSMYEARGRLTVIHFFFAPKSLMFPSILEAGRYRCRRKIPWHYSPAVAANKSFLATVVTCTSLGQVRAHFQHSPV